jgi:hypothetical protein
VEAALAICIGIGLAAACGFRVFLPLLAVSAAAHVGYLDLAAGFQWMSGTPALIAFATATVLEILAYYVPWLDHLLDAIATPAAVLAGIVASASILVELPPFTRWTVAIIAGGGVAAGVQGTTVLLRLKSAALTGGLGNPVVATIEWIGAAITSVLAIVVPVLCVLLLAAVLVVVLVASRRIAARRGRAG